MALSCYFGAEISLSEDFKQPENLVTPVIPPKSLLSVTQVSISSESFLANLHAKREYEQSRAATSNNSSSANKKQGGAKGKFANKNNKGGKKDEKGEEQGANNQTTKELDDRVVLFAQGTQSKKPIALCTLQPSKGILHTKLNLLFSKYAAFYLVSAFAVQSAIAGVPLKKNNAFNPAQGLRVHVTGYYECDDGDDGADEGMGDSDDEFSGDSDMDDGMDFDGLGGGGKKKMSKKSRKLPRKSDKAAEEDDEDEDSELAPFPPREQRRGSGSKSKTAGAPRGSGAYHASRPQNNNNGGGNGRQKRGRE